ncbi:NUDIX hydrolase [Roseicyclus sp. F158]|uniref:NUDIX hydrolase n=1 Tax=Tropicimonas omnivorans TaxID=3075590 RepID=A0ABU3DGP2_9RHOB|nr:NUDIX hydrolase [Roseicyclus sp. F158]MDT0682864.1 NUDIX hydrolase [Roseicyclus sp. F158]
MSRPLTEASHIPVRPAATVIFHREAASGPEVLMGRRGGRAAFLPGRMVFPGGAVEDADEEIPLAAMPPERELHRLGLRSGLAPRALLVAAIRETWEETGLILGAAGAWKDPPAGWRGFARAGYLPDASALRLVLRAVTPPDRPRRFDARIFSAPAAALIEAGHAGDGELSSLAWVPMEAALADDPPFITRLALGELADRFESPDLPPRLVACEARLTRSSRLG